MYDAPEFSANWFVLALINAGIAQGKGRSGGNWFLLSLFMGPFATFCLVLTETLPRTPATTVPPLAQPVPPATFAPPSNAPPPAAYAQPMHWAPTPPAPSAPQGPTFFPHGLPPTMAPPPVPDDEEEDDDDPGPAADPPRTGAPYPEPPLAPLDPHAR